MLFFRHRVAGVRLPPPPLVSHILGVVRVLANKCYPLQIAIAHQGSPPCYDLKLRRSTFAPSAQGS